MKTTRSAAFTPLQRPPTKTRQKSTKPSATRTLKRPEGRAPLRAEFRAWRASLPAGLERDTLLTPEWIAENVVQEVERFLNADLPAGFAERLAARAYHLYSRHKHFKKGLNRPGNGGRETLVMFMRHWTAGWLKRDRNPLHKKLPYSFGMGQRLPDAVRASFRQGCQTL